MKRRPGSAPSARAALHVRRPLHAPRAPQPAARTMSGLKPDGEPGAGTGTSPGGGSPEDEVGPAGWGGRGLRSGSGGGGRDPAWPGPGAPPRLEGACAGARVGATGTPSRAPTPTPLRDLGPRPRLAPGFRRARSGARARATDPRGGGRAGAGVAGLIRFREETAETTQLPGPFLPAARSGLQSWLGLRPCKEWEPRLAHPPCAQTEWDGAGCMEPPAVGGCWEG